LDILAYQYIGDQKKEEDKATKTNDWAANEIKGYRDKLGAFACLFCIILNKLVRIKTLCYRVWLP
jgi:hypothetical protein